MDPKEKKLLVITEVFAPEEFLINDLVFSWQQKGYSVSVLTRNPSYPGGKIFPGYRNRLFHHEVINGVSVYRVQFIPGYKNSRVIKVMNYLWNMKLAMLWAMLNGRKFDSVFIYQTGPLTFSSAGALMKKMFGTKTTIWIQDVWPETVFAYGLANKGISRVILEKFVKWVYAGCDNITVSCPGFATLISKYNRLKEITFIPQWSMTGKLAAGEMNGKTVNYPGKFNFVFAGNIGKVQNLENTVKGFDLFMKKTASRDTWLNLIGDGSHLDYLKELVQENHMENIRFRGRMASSEMPLFYDKADVLVISLENSPVFNLTIPAKFQSYLNAGKPMFGIISGEVAELISTHNLGWVADPDNPEDIAMKFGEIAGCSNESLSEKTKNADNLTAGLFDRSTIINKITDLVFS
jgi:glycosyltransferase involved in cell wall biosynthesis